MDAQARYVPRWLNHRPTQRNRRTVHRSRKPIYVRLDEGRLRLV